MVCVVCCVKIFFNFWGKLQRGGWKATSSAYTFQNEVVLPLVSLSARPQVNEKVFFLHDWKKK
jgi:hypothetical protein